MVEDDRDVAELVAFTLAGAGHEVRTAFDGQAGLREFELFSPEVVILDVSLPDRNGMEVLQAIRRSSRVPALLLTARSTLADKTRGFRMGADDYLVKPFLPTELALRVDALLRRSSWGTDPAGRVGDLEIDHAARVVARGGAPLGLSPMEFDLLAALVSTPGRPWSAERLARRLGLEAGSPALAAEMIRVKVSRLRRKIGPGYVRTRRGVGYLLEPGHPVR